MNDMHTHILPGIDDGSKTSEMSVAMIKKLTQQGVKNIVLTPHFYAQQNSVDDFLKSRDTSLAHLKNYLGEEKLDAKIFWGAEVFFMDSLDKVEGFERMAIEGTKYMLLEMPFSQWQNRTLETVYRITNVGITPIIAHFERFIPFQKDMGIIYELRNMECVFQMNSEFFNGFFNKRKAVKFFDEGLAQLIGSDAHNLDRRPPDVKNAYDIIEKTLGKEAVNRITELGNRILENAVQII